tara:strand:- start:18 stop:296 length:279 start_codon:yes stop_codon:yes gene_type:complete
MSEDYGKLEKNIPIGDGGSKYHQIFPEVGDCRWVEETENPVPKDKTGRIMSVAKKKIYKMYSGMQRIGMAPQTKIYYSGDGSISGYRIWRTK